MTTSTPITPVAATVWPTAQAAPRRRVAQLLALAFGLSLVYTLVTTSTGTAPSDFDATTPVVWIGYLAGTTATVLALRDGRWARWTVGAMVAAFLASAFLVYPHYFTAEHQDTLGWFENDAYVALLALALHEHVRLGRRQQRAV